MDVFQAKYSSLCDGVISLIWCEHIGPVINFHKYFQKIVSRLTRVSGMWIDFGWIDILKMQTMEVGFGFVFLVVLVQGVANIRIFKYFPIRIFVRIKVWRIYSNIRIYWSRIFIRTFIRINFSFTNIFGHLFVPKKIRSRVC